jgi:hypothetical protein
MCLSVYVELYVTRMKMRRNTLKIKERDPVNCRMTAI